ncbi:DEAD/DEAH box helicase [Myceligenerans indicum]|uniref:DEAD/DEAH box helicase n=1 Tax=Myceligenerans indicum TaxID=2593663 RepID=A0ABS1LJG9_9MICO|nr:DEAD/DEAH box helicase [Myceligenerans indicum]MBL0886377.1 DEAD/DEAH box helicase [Myceligenerans indicum]
MRLRDLLRGHAAETEQADDAGFTVEPRDGMVAFTFPPEALAGLRSGIGSPRSRLQLLALEALAEQGVALEVSDGFVVTDGVVAALDTDEAAFLGVPDAFPGSITGAVRGATTSSRFVVELQAVDGRYPQPVRRTGPFIEVGTRRYRLAPAALDAVRAVEEHAGLAVEERTETRNVRLLAQLRRAMDDVPDAGPPDREGPVLDLDLRQLEGRRVVQPDRVGLIVDERPDGGLDVQPDLGAGVDAEKAARRWHQLDSTNDGGVLRIDDDLVLLDDQERRAVDEVRQNPHIPAEQRDDFFAAPGDFFDPELVDVELGFGYRVKGIGKIAPVTFAKAAESGLTWLARDVVAGPEALAGKARTLPEHTEIEEQVGKAWEQDREVLTLGDDLVDIADRSRVKEALAASRKRLEELGADLAGSLTAPAGEQPDSVRVGVILKDTTDLAEQQRVAARGAIPRKPVACEDLHFTPYPHQRDGIEWMTGLMHAALAADGDDPARVQGAILADDMGLGKTFMTLVALRESLRAEQDDPNHGPAGHARPTLAVLPVALVENWLDELARVFPESPFDDVVVLQGAGLKQYRLLGVRRETAVEADDLDAQGIVRKEVVAQRTSLRIGPGPTERPYGATRLDMPNRLVLTTYETLQRYQISLGQVDWGVVVMDEAQKIKNPETLAARAAKGLRARFKLLATGTPVENELKDFWSLLDTAQPGLLGAYPDFRTRWIAPMEEATGAAKGELGRDLRAAVGPFMLRRVKEDHLTDLPAKSVHKVPLAMPQVQVDAYDDVLHRFRTFGGGVKGAALKALQQLKGVSLHPSATADSSGPLSADAAAMLDSARMHGMLDALDDVRRRGEKAIVFAIDKRVQRALAGWLMERYGLTVSVVNGDTAATSAGGGATRKTLIRRFEAADGFNVIIMSPLAVGVGLTVVGANHAIHLERHWNPAKEAQATDRIHRIGQTREVHVYLPMAIHPDRDSFDVNLDRLLESKTLLKDAVVAPEVVSEDELFHGLGLDGDSVRGGAVKS